MLQGWGNHGNAGVKDYVNMPINMNLFKLTVKDNMT
jgi:hypothetical protein